MAQLTLRTRGPAGPDAVWQRYAEPDRWPTWSPQVRGVDYPHRRLQAWTAGRVHGPWRLSVPFRVEAVDESRRSWSWTVRPEVAGLTVARMRLEHRVGPALETAARSRKSGGAADRAAGGCVTSLRLHARAPVLAVYAPVAWVALKRLVR